MILWGQTTLTGWGRTSRAATSAARPHTLSAVQEAVQNSPAILAHGLGRSYGDAALPTEAARAILTDQLDQLVSFDPQSGVLVAQAGVSFKTILETFLPRGWLIPVAPGTSFVTLGGAIANNVHGKNHPVAGALSRHILWVEVLTADGRVCRFSRTENAPAFFATLGGIGLTGIIVQAALQLTPAAGSCVAVTQHRCKNLEDLLAAFTSKPERDDYAVAWLDALSGGAALGRSIFERAHIAPGNAPVRLDGGPVFPLDLPSFALNPLSIRLFNKVRYAWVGRANPTLSIVPHAQFFYPLDRIQHWNRMYGKRGFHQFQCVIPDAAAPQALPKLLEMISQSARASFLAVLKRLGQEDENYLSYAMPGYVLALDFPNSPGTPEFLSTLNKFTRDVGGRVYLAKDSTLTADDLAAMYPRLPDFKRVLAELDPQEKFTSRMAQRLGLRRTA